MIKKLPEAPKSPVKFWAFVIGIPVALILVGVGMFLYQGSSKEIESVADQFNPGAGWSLEEEHIEPPRAICLNDVPCPSIQKRWMKSIDLSRDDFSKMLASVNWHMPIEGTCVPDANVSGTKGSVCSAKGEINGYQVYVAVNKSISYPSGSDIVLRVN